MGHSSPYRAVANLALAAALHWRTIRARLILAGIADPLRSLPDMHAILDVTEAVIIENMPKDEREKLIDNLYRPEPGQKPKNFEEEDQLDAFAAFEQMAGGMK